MELADERTLEPGQGEVSYSERKSVPGFLIKTESGVTLKCSDTAPIPTPDGLVLAPQLLGKDVPVRTDAGGLITVGWETVISVVSIGTIQVQHITVGDRCFWAGEKAGAYILHHNLKDAGGDDPDPWDDDGWWRAASTSDEQPAPAKASAPPAVSDANMRALVALINTSHHTATAPETAPALAVAAESAHVETVVVGLAHWHTFLMPDNSSI
jgi:hypothetical protein